MTRDAGVPTEERAQTDDSLRTERDQIDQALVEAQTSIDREADALVQRARDKADALIETARTKADESAAETQPLGEERAHEDRAIAEERAAADASLALERLEDEGTLAKLLPLERERTDRHLLTERERSDDAVSHRDDFLGMVSHDLRNLLGGIVMSAEILSRKSSDQETLLGTKRIQRYAARMNRLIGDLVDIASIDAGKLALVPTSGDARALIAEAADLFEVSAAAGGVALKSVAGEALPASFDHDRLLQVVANLITNAIKFTPTGGRISVDAQRDAGMVRFVVSDTGSGIPSTMLEAIFERFWQVGKNDRRGVGLGLYISKCIVEAHGGSIWAESALGAGSTFCFTLPTSIASS